MLPANCQARKFNFKMLKNTYNNNGYINVAFLYFGEESNDAQIKIFTRKISAEIGATDDLDKWSLIKPIYKIDLTYKNISKITTEKRFFLNSFYLLSIFQLSSAPNQIGLNFNKVRKELKFTNSFDYPKESIKLKPTEKSFNQVKYWVFIK
jgi:hypothetical protein